MSRHKHVDGVDIQFTPEEETARDVEEAVWEEEGPARAMVNLRRERNALLVSSDWTQASDSPLTDEVQAEWLTYREELRDFPESADPADPTWPTPPE